MRKSLSILVYLFGLQVCSCIEWDVFSTKTAYKWSHDGIKDTAEDTVVIENTVYTAIHVNGVYRHGARNPTDSSIEEIHDLHTYLMDNRNKSKFIFLDTWNSSKYDITKESELVHEGITEHIELGKRMSARFNELFRSNGQHIKFVSSRKSRASDSSKYFYEGLSNKSTNIGSYDNEINDKTMRFYEDCKNYEEQVENSNYNMRQFKVFNITPAYQNVVMAVTDRLGLEKALTHDEMYQIYKLCSYEKFIFNSEEWCSLMTDAERKVLEYGQDLEKYYESSYGHPMNSMLSCPLVRDMFLTMDRAMNDTWDNNGIGNGTGYLAGKFQFTHSETIVQLFTALGLFKDSRKLMAFNTGTMANRIFRTSHIAPFSANLVFAVYASNPKGENHTDKRKYLLKLFVNEKPVVIPACNSEVCEYGQVRSHYDKLITSCNITDICFGPVGNYGADGGAGGAASDHGSLWVTLWLCACYVLMIQ